MFFSICLPEGKWTHQPFVLSVASSFCGESVVQQEENIPEMGCINNQTTWIRILCIYNYIYTGFTTLTSWHFMILLGWGNLVLIDPAFCTTSEGANPTNSPRSPKHIGYLRFSNPFALVICIYTLNIWVQFSNIHGLGNPHNYMIHYNHTNMSNMMLVWFAPSPSTPPRILPLLLLPSTWYCGEVQLRKPVEFIGNCRVKGRKNVPWWWKPSKEMEVDGIGLTTSMKSLCRKIKRARRAPLPPQVQVLWAR